MSDGINGGDCRNTLASRAYPTREPIQVESSAQSRDLLLDWGTIQASRSAGRNQPSILWKQDRAQGVNTFTLWSGSCASSAMRQNDSPAHGACLPIGYDHSGVILQARTRKAPNICRMFQYASRPTQHRHHAYESPAKREEITGLPNTVISGGSTILARWSYGPLTLS